MNEVRKLFVNFITAVKPRMNHPPKHHFYEILVGLWHWMIPNPEMLTSNTLHHLGSSVRLILARWRNGTRAEPLKAGFCSHSWWNCLFSVAKVAQTIHVLLVHSLFFVAWTPKFACNKKQPCFFPNGSTQFSSHLIRQNLRTVDGAICDVAAVGVLAMRCSVPCQATKMFASPIIFNLSLISTYYVYIYICIYIYWYMYIYINPLWTI